MACLVDEPVQEWRAINQHTGPEDSLFASELGSPVAENNILPRHA